MCLYVCTKPYICMHRTHVTFHILGQDTWEKLRQKKKRKWQRDLYTISICVFLKKKKKQHIMSNRSLKNWLQFGQENWGNGKITSRNLRTILQVIDSVSQRLRKYTNGVNFLNFLWDKEIFWLKWLITKAVQGMRKVSEQNSGFDRLCFVLF